MPLCCKSSVKKQVISCCVKDFAIELFTWAALGSLEDQQENSFVANVHQVCIPALCVKRGRQTWSAALYPTVENSTMRPVWRNSTWPCLRAGVFGVLCTAASVVMLVTPPIHEFQKERWCAVFAVLLHTMLETCALLRDVQSSLPTALFVRTISLPWKEKVITRMSMWAGALCVPKEEACCAASPVLQRFTRTA